jgi:hypothetical protein
LGISIGGTILQNQLEKHLPRDFLSQFSRGGEAISIVPLLHDLPQPELNEVRMAFADSLGTLWNIMAGVSGLGFIASLLMRHQELNPKVDEDWGMKVEKESMEKGANGKA